MKKFNLLVIIGSIVILGQAMGQEMALKTSTGNSAASASQISWVSKDINVGVVKLNQPPQITYQFTNTGETPLVIKDVRTSCGCTVAKHSREPVLPGESSEIKVEYNAKRVGVFNKSVTVTTSVDENPIVLRLSGEVQ